MVVATKTVSVSKMPVDALDGLGPHAIQNGYPDSDSGRLRFAGVELWRRLRRESEHGDNGNRQDLISEPATGETAADSGVR